MFNQSSSKFSISEISIRRHIGTFMLAIALVVVGILFVFRLQVDLLPAITYPRIGLRLEAPGIAPEVAIEEITKPLESALSATEGVELLYSETREGRISIDLFFETGGDIDQALNDTTEAFNRVRNRLPDDLEQPRLFKFEPSQLPIYEFAIESDSLQDLDLSIFAKEELSRELGFISGVSSVNVSGGVNEEIRIKIDEQRLQSLNLSLQDILNSLSDRNNDISGGRLTEEKGEPLTRTVARFRNVEEIINLPIFVNSNTNQNSLLNSPVYLRDIAQIMDGQEDQRVFVSLNGKESLKISIQKQPSANTITVIKKVKEKLLELKKAQLIPEDLKIVTTLDESVLIENSIKNVITSGIMGTILTGITVFIFLGSIRQTLIIVTAIPLGTLLAVLLMKLFGLSLNIFSLGGLALGVGMVIDNSIVVLDNIETNAQNNLNPLIKNNQENVIISSQQVESALVASTTSNLISVLPFLLLGGVFSLIFNELILTISFSAFASLVFALTLVPALAGQLLTVSWSSNVSNFYFLKLVKNIVEKLTLAYSWLLKNVLKLRFIIIILTITLLTFSSLSMLPQIKQEILPKINTGQVNLLALFPPGISLEENRKVMKIVDEIMMKQPETENVFTTTGGFLFGGNTSANLLRSSSNITLKPDTNTLNFIEKVEKELKKLNLVDIRLRLFPSEIRGINLRNTPIGNSDLEVILEGNNQELLNKTGKELLNILDEKVTSAKFRPSADAQQQEIQIIPDVEKLSILGLNAQNIGEIIETAITGSIPAQLQREQRLINIRVQLGENATKTRENLENIPLFISNNNQILLRDIATIQNGKSPGQIQRINQKNVFILSGNLSENASLNDALSQLKLALTNIDLPSGITLLPNTSEKENQKLVNSLKLIGGLATFFVFVIIAVQYNSLIDPFVIMLTVPLALTGGIFGLYITETPMSASVLVGVILLVGIVVNNAIVMVELANQFKVENNFTYRQAILKAAPQRLRPILMTTITTVLGLYPLTLEIGQGSEFLQPLGVVIFYGLSFATLLTLFIIPCFYVILHGIFNFQQKKLTAKNIIKKIKIPHSSQ